MKVLGAITGISGFRAPPEEIGSRLGAPLQEQLAFIGATFQFSVVPPIGQPQLNAALTFQHGQIAIGEERAAVYSFVSAPDGILASCRSTEIADLVINTFCEGVDRRFGSRYR
jgi:hypothetical protein